MKNKIPKGWMDYLPYGDKVEGTKLFPFKTPLKLEMQSNIPAVRRFTPACLIANIPKLKAVIDLTDTDARADRYYSPKEFLDSNVDHLKMQISGGGVVPGKDKIKLFSDAVEGFLKKYADDPDALIGVHCTHGLNRTGYFICMYMVTRMGCNPIEAIDRFQRARGYEMYRQNFIEEIMEPGKHTSGSQKPNYGGKDGKLVRQVGNYSYENNWLENNTKKPFRGFHDREVQNTGSRSNRERNGTRIWRHQNDSSRVGDVGIETLPLRRYQRRDFPSGGETSREFPQGRERSSFEDRRIPDCCPRRTWSTPTQSGEGLASGGQPGFPLERLGLAPNQFPRLPIGGERIFGQNPLQSDQSGAGLPRCSYNAVNWRPPGLDNRGMGTWRGKSGRGRSQEVPRRGGFRRNSRDNVEYRSPLDGQYSEEAPRRDWRGNRRGGRSTYN
ncbi:RNA/RNP complex-1-interacting phosphatase [Coccinella septempunctata]|uniref:RNA/RNP complex-1-interacting phosphatase n=1 Tax=Coccinella septempunctata TaxID=41139 RepID=UPI001D06B55A|nr:RNA/RNP complex-1-interacting phosphatase [Coccinella septempunctata]